MCELTGKNAPELIVSTIHILTLFILYLKCVPFSHHLMKWHQNLNPLQDCKSLGNVALNSIYYGENTPVTKLACSILE